MHDDEAGPVLVVPVTSTSVVITSTANQSQNVVLVDASAYDAGEPAQIPENSHEPAPELPPLTGSVEKDTTLVLGRNGSIESCSEASSSSSAAPPLRSDLHQSDATEEEEAPVDLHVIGKGITILFFFSLNQAFVACRRVGVTSFLQIMTLQVGVGRREVIAQKYYKTD